MPKRYKLVFNVPIKDADTVRAAIGDAGAGRAGNYTYCSFSVRGTGRFLPMAGANPHIGQVGQLETVEEEQVQVDVLEDDLRNVLAALKAVHPYEEIGYEIYEMIEVF